MLYGSSFPEVLRPNCPAFGFKRVASRASICHTALMQDLFLLSVLRTLLISRGFKAKLHVLRALISRSVAALSHSLSCIISSILSQMHDLSLSLFGGPSFPGVLLLNSSLYCPVLWFKKLPYAQHLSE